MGVAFLVDGHTEQRFIQIICPKKPVQRINLNGGAVGAEAIAKRVATQIRLWGGKHHPIIVVMDLEDRDIPHEQFATNLLAEIRNQQIFDEIVIGVANRMIENWIIADYELIGWNECPDNVDGLHGAGQLKAIVGNYDKAGDGPEFLARARPSRIMQRSPSFSDFFGCLAALRGCFWLER